MGRVRVVVVVGGARVRLGQGAGRRGLARSGARASPLVRRTVEGEAAHGVGGQQGAGEGRAPGLPLALAPAHARGRQPGLCRLARAQRQAGRSQVPDGLRQQLRGQRRAALRAARAQEQRGVQLLPALRGSLQHGAASAQAGGAAGVAAGKKAAAREVAHGTLHDKKAAGAVIAKSARAAD